MSHEKAECVLQLAVEGGGVEFLRQWSDDGAGRFIIQSLGSVFDMDDFDEFRTPPKLMPPQEFLTLDDAVANFSADGQWVGWAATEVHPDYREAVWLLREKTIELLDDYHVKFARRIDRRWARACGR